MRAESEERLKVDVRNRINSEKKAIPTTLERNKDGLLSEPRHNTTTTEDTYGLKFKTGWTGQTWTKSKPPQMTAHLRPTKLWSRAQLREKICPSRMEVKRTDLSSLGSLKRRGGLSNKHPHPVGINLDEGSTQEVLCRKAICWSFYRIVLLIIARSSGFEIDKADPTIANNRELKPVYESGKAMEIFRKMEVDWKFGADGEKDKIAPLPNPSSGSNDHQPMVLDLLYLGKRIDSSYSKLLTTHKAGPVGLFGYITPAVKPYGALRQIESSFNLTNLKGDGDGYVKSKSSKVFMVKIKEMKLDIGWNEEERRRIWNTAKRWLKLLDGMEFCGPTAQAAVRTSEISSRQRVKRLIGKNIYNLQLANLVSEARFMRGNIQSRRVDHTAEAE
ncbi:hypothetical protein BY996DRAFT_6582936 [Phakopsora pachyrhizi]|nr:hypothetical protein BY996DRAFT_6582936 [Phakopsora pachyrhizi]